MILMILECNDNLGATLQYSDKDIVSKRSASNSCVLCSLINIGKNCVLDNVRLNNSLNQEHNKTLKHNEKNLQLFNFQYSPNE